MTRAGQDGIEFSARVALSAHVPVDDLTLCNCYRQSAGERPGGFQKAPRRFEGERFIRVQAKWMEDPLMMLVENSFDGKIRQSGGNLLSGMKDGGLGILSIRRILNQTEDEFDVDYNVRGRGVVTAMVRISGRGCMDGKELHFWGNEV